MTRKLHENLWTIVFALIFVLLAQWVGPVVGRAWNASSPVVNFTYSIVAQTDYSVTVNIAGDKLRDCDYVSVMALVGGENSTKRDINIMRVDKPSTGSSRPVGPYNLGDWKMWPVINGEIPSIILQHNCQGVIMFYEIPRKRDHD